MGALPAFWSCGYWISTWVTNAAISIAAVSYLSTLSPGFFAVRASPRRRDRCRCSRQSPVSVRMFRAACNLTSVLGSCLIAAMVIALIVLGNGDQQAQFARRRSRPTER